MIRNRNFDILHFSQQTYVNFVFKRFDMKNCNSITIFMKFDIRLKFQKKIFKQFQRSSNDIKSLLKILFIFHRKFDQISHLQFKFWSNLIWIFSKFTNRSLNEFLNIWKKSKFSTLFTTMTTISLITRMLIEQMISKLKNQLKFTYFRCMKTFSIDNRNFKRVLHFRHVKSNTWHKRKFRKKSFE